MSESPECPVLTAEQAQAVIALGRAFLSAVRAWTLYPPEHPAVRTAVTRLRDTIDDSVVAQVAGAISVTPTALLVAGAAVGDADPVIGEMAALLHSHGVLEIGFDPLPPPEAPERLLELLSRPPGSFAEQGGLSQVWQRLGHPAIRIVAVDYRKVLEDREGAESAGPRRDDIWRAIVAALRSGGPTLDERAQQRLLELAEDPRELTALAGALIADKCTAGGSPMLMTQAATVLAGFRRLASIASVLAPERAQAVLENLARALVPLDPHVSLQVLALEGETVHGASPLATGLGEEGVAQLLAAVLALDGQSSPRAAEVFNLLVPDAARRRAVLDRARAFAAHTHAGIRPFDEFWHSIEELLLPCDDRAFVGGEYRAVLDGAGAGSGAGDRPSLPPTPELSEWLATVTEQQLRQLSVVLLADLLRLETQTDRARAVLDELVVLGDNLFAAGAYEDALLVLDGIREGGNRADLAEAAGAALARIGTSDGVREAAAILGDLRPDEWDALARCYGRIGPSCLVALRDPLLAEHQVAAGRAGDVFVAMGEASVTPLLNLLADAPAAPCRRIATLLGRIASPSAVPGLQCLLRVADDEVIEAAVRALADIGDGLAVRAIHVALRTCDARARERVIDALVAVNDRRVVPMLLAVLEGSRPLGADFRVVLHVLDALARLRDARSVRVVAGVLFLRVWFLRACISRRRLRMIKHAAAHALAQTGDLAALQALERARRTGDRIQRRVAREAAVHLVEGAA